MEKKIEKTLAYFVTNLHAVRFSQRRPVSEKVIETIEIPAYLMVIFPPGVRCNSGHNKFWTIEFHRDTTTLSIASLELFGIPPETQPRFGSGREEFACKTLVLGDTFFDIEGMSKEISVERIVGEDTLDYSHFIEKFFSEKKEKLPGRAVKTRMLGWHETGKVDEFL
jgi:hypothetical protein